MDSWVFGLNFTHLSPSLSPCEIRHYKNVGATSSAGDQTVISHHLPIFHLPSSSSSLSSSSSSASSSSARREAQSFCMAASSRTSGIAGIGKRVVSQIWSPIKPLPPPSSLPLRRASHTSVYDKNPEDQITSSAVPDEVIEAPSDKYWAPHPKTGVFGPVTDQHLRAHGELPKPGNAESSVLEHTAWFRPTSLEDLEKPPHH